MRVVTSISEMQSRADAFRKEGRTIGLVPTMGFLHEGHLALMRAARTGNDVVVASIFVNPAQFGPGDDLSRYPRDLAGDLARCAEAAVDAVLAPEDQSDLAASLRHLLLQFASPPPPQFDPSLGRP